jgi:hypothetical protein
VPRWNASPEKEFVQRVSLSLSRVESAGVVQVHSMRRACPGANKEGNRARGTVEFVYDILPLGV